MSIATGINVTTYTDFGFTTGTFVQMSNAIQIAWEQAEDFIGTTLRPVSYTDEYHQWPSNGILSLNKSKLNTVDLVTARHDDEDCECSVTDYTGCAQVSNYDLSIIVIRDCNSAATCENCTKKGYENPKWAIIDYTAGYAISGLTISHKYAICLLASIYLEQQTGDIEVGNPPITAYKSLSYSETRMKPRINRLGQDYRSNQAYSLLRGLLVKRSPMHHSQIHSGRMF